MRHYSKEKLELYRHKEMSVLGRITCAAHLRECAKCRKLLDELTDDDKLLSEMRTSIEVFRDITGAFPRKTLKKVVRDE